MKVSGAILSEGLSVKRWSALNILNLIIAVNKQKNYWGEKMEELKNYIINRLSDIEVSLRDELISEKEVAYLLGQKVELLAIKQLMGW